MIMDKHENSIQCENILWVEEKNVSSETQMCTKQVDSLSVLLLFAPDLWERERIPDQPEL